MTPHEQAADLLARHGVRATRQRISIVEALAEERDDATAQEIYDALRRSGGGTGRATVYRTLQVLSSRGVVDELNHRPRETCYRLCSEGHHHHLVCTRCHRVVELGDCDVEEWLSALADKHGFTVSGHTFEATGTCVDCRAALA